jgi:FtsZ-interacting cell division protein ZipA
MNFNKNRNIAPNMKPSNFLRVDTIISPTETSDSYKSYTSGSSSSPLLSSSESEKKSKKKSTVVANTKPKIVVNTKPIVVNNPQPSQPTPPPATPATQNQPVQNQPVKNQPEQNQPVSKNPSGPTNKPEVKIEKFSFNFEKFTQETISNMTIEKGIVISCVIFTVICAIIGFWHLIFKMTNNQKYYNYSYKMPTQASYGNIPVTSSTSRFMYR